jgi:hypothetical protein
VIVLPEYQPGPVGREAEAGKVREQVGKWVSFKLFARVPGGRVSYDETIRQHRRRPGPSGDEEADVCLLI